MTEDYQADVLFHDEGSVIMVEPVTAAGIGWVRVNVPLESWQWIGNRFACEPRMAENLLNGMVEGGLRVS